MQILYEDNHMLVVVKPKGILSQADGSDKKDMLTLLKAYLKEKYQKPGNVYLGLVHRLDLNTSGVMVFAKTSKAAKRLSEQIANHSFKKRYHALVEGYLEANGSIESYLRKNEQEKKSYLDSNGQKAILNYTILGHKKIGQQEVSFVDIQLLTGRFHQIRVQFSSIGHPIFGDKKYGSLNQISPLEFPLDAYQIELVHPIQKNIMTFSYETLHL